MNSTTTQTNASAATTAQTPNYRIYDRTGGGVTEDIYATSLDDAIEQGREWIEAGDWSGCAGDDEDGGETCRTIALECCVGEIVRDEDGEIDSRATYDGAHDCSGSYTPDMPECEMAEHASEDDTTDDEGHVWREPFSAVGGCKENPGVWSGGGTRMTYHSVCRLCGCHKHTSDPGCQRNPDEAKETVTIKPRDEASEAWLKRTHEEDGWIPEWLAEMLGCSPSVKMTDEQAREYVASHDDDDDLDDDDLEHAFAAIFNRRADDEDRAQGLWSHLCASAKPTATIGTEESAATTAQGQQFDVYRAKFFAHGWTREKIATITAADEGEAHLICKRDLKPEFDGTSHTNTMMGDLRVFPAGEQVALSGKWSREARDKRHRQLFA